MKALFLAILFASLSVWALQAPSVPAHLEVEAPRILKGGEQGKVSIKLQDAKGHPMAATHDLKFSVKASAGHVDQQTVVIHKGDSSADVTISKNEPGLSNISVEPADSASVGLAGGAQVGFTPDASYRPVLPLSLLVTVQPVTKLKAGLETARVIVRYIDKSKVPVPAQKATQVAFPGFGDFMTPSSINLAAGDLYGAANLSSPTPLRVSLSPIASPPISITNETGTVEFVSPIVATRTAPAQGYMKSVRRPQTTLTVGFVDGDGNWIAADKDRNLTLQVDPPSAGMLAVSEISLPKGQLNATTTYIAMQEGAAKIKATSGDIPPQVATFEFYYAAVYFWLIAAVGGLIGGGVRNAAGSDHSVKKILIHVGGGLVIGVLTNLVAPLLVGISLKPAGLENSSKIFEAFAWGFLGGGSGITILSRIFASKVEEAAAKPQPSAAAAKSGG